MTDFHAAWRWVGAAFCLGVSLMGMSGCAAGVGGRQSPWIPLAEFQGKAAPGTPVIHVLDAAVKQFDGSLQDAAWQKATAYRDFGLHTGAGLTAFPTSVRFLKSGRVLWVGLDCRVPPDKKGEIPADAVDKDLIEVWVDLGPSRYQHYQIMFKPDGTIQTPWVPAETLAKGFIVKTRRRADGYTAEIRIDLDALTDFGPPPGPNVGFNLARGGPGGWASLVGVVGHVHKPAQFWELDMTGKLAERPPVNVFRDPFQKGTDVRAAARALVDGWRLSMTGPHDRTWARMQVMIDALQRKMAEDEKDPWGRPQELAVMAWRALVGWQAQEGRTIEMPESVAKLCGRLAVYPGGTYPKTQWREEAFVSTFDGTAQPYVIRVPADYNPKTPLPLVLFLHGSGTTQQGDGAIYERYEADPRCILVRVNGRQYQWFDTLAMRDTLQVIEDVKSQYAVDRDRIYLTGYSAGAYGSMALGATCPQEFAALESSAGGLEGKYPETLKNLNLLFVHGFADPVVPPGRKAGMLALELRGLGAPARLSLIPASGHGVPVEGFENYLMQFRRQAVPESVACFTDLWNPVPLRQYWVSIVALQKPHDPGAVRADIVGGGTALRVQTANVVEAALDVGDFATAGRGRPTSMIVDGQSLEMPAGAFISLKREGYRWKAQGTTLRPEADPTHYRAGGVLQFYADGSPLIVAPEKLMDAAAKMAHRSVNGTSQWINIPVVKDTDASEEMLRKHHLILLGSAAVNKVTAQLMAMQQDWPVAMDKNSVVLDKKHSYSLAGNVVEVMTYHPLNRALRAWVVLADGPEGLGADSPILKGNVPGAQRPDITVTEIKANKAIEYRRLKPDWTPEGSSMWED